MLDVSAIWENEVPFGLFFCTKCNDSIKQSYERNISDAQYAYIQSMCIYSGSVCCMVTKAFVLLLMRWCACLPDPGKWRGMSKQNHEQDLYSDSKLTASQLGLCKRRIQAHAGSPLCHGGHSLFSPLSLAD